MENYSCQLCDKAFSQQANLKRHMRVIHFKVKKYNCEICSKTFGQKSNAKIHMKFCENRNFAKPEVLKMTP